MIKRKELIVSGILLLATFMLKAQSKEEILEELRSVLRSKNKLVEVLYNEYSGVLDINGNLIPLADVGMYYNESRGAMLVFQCESRTKTNCIYKPVADRKFENFSIPMDDKDSIAKAVYLIKQLPVSR